jgi:hypothetical protein
VRALRHTRGGVQPLLTRLAPPRLGADAFGVIMARVNVVNLNLVQLPKTGAPPRARNLQAPRGCADPRAATTPACLNPNPSFYSEFNGSRSCGTVVRRRVLLRCLTRRVPAGYTLGLLFAMFSMAALWVLGTHGLARVTLRGLPPDERAERLTRFNSTVLTRALLVLYLVYPGARVAQGRAMRVRTADLPAAACAGVSVAIFSVFTCTRLESGVSYLNADARIMCWDAEHRRYVGGAIVWLLIVPVGVPASFIWLLRRFRVPQMAALLEQNAWLRAAIAHAWREGLAQPPGAACLAVDTIPTAHLEALHAFFLRDVAAEEASDILLGKAPPVAEGDDSAAAAGALKSDAAGSTVVARVSARLRRSSSLLTGARAAEQAEPLPLDPAARRELLLAELLRWCQTSGDVAIPGIVWGVLDEEEEALPAAAAAVASDGAMPSSTAAAAGAPKVRTKDVPQLLEHALSECGCASPPSRACGGRPRGAGCLTRAMRRATLPAFSSRTIGLAAGTGSWLAAVRASGPRGQRHAACMQQR